MALNKFTVFAAVLLAAFSFTFAGINNDELLKYAAKSFTVYTTCSKETSLKPELAAKILNTVMNYDPLPEGPGVKCYIACHLQGVGMAKDGVMLWDSIADVQKKVYPEEDMKKILEAIEICRKSDQKSADPCEGAYAAGKCYYENLKKLKVSPVKTDLKIFNFQ